MVDEDAGRGSRVGGAEHQSNYLSAQHARIAKRRGTGRAQVAVAHSILVSGWHMLTKDEPYQDLGANWLARRNDEAHARRLVAQFERLGHTVQLDTANGPGWWWRDTSANWPADP